MESRRILLKPLRFDARLRERYHNGVVVMSAAAIGNDQPPGEIHRGGFFVRSRTYALPHIEYSILQPQRTVLGFLFSS